MTSNNNNCPVPVLERRYNSAIALNNIAVHLLECNCFEQAIESLQEAAIPLMQTLLLNDQEHHSLPSSTPCLDAQNGGEPFVQRAMRHLMMDTTAPARRSVLLFEVVTVSPDGSLVCGELPAGNRSRASPSSSTCLESILQTVPCSSAAFLIRIEENLLLQEPLLLFQNDGSNHKAQETGSTLGMALLHQLAMMSHNLSIACLCQSKTVAHRRESYALRKIALGLSNYAYSVHLKSLCAAVTSEQQEQQLLDDYFQQEQRLRNLPCLMICILNSLIAVLNESSRPHRATYFYGCLCLFRSLALDWQFKDAAVNMPAWDSSTPAAAAA